VSRRDDADVDVYGTGCADLLDLALLNQTQNSNLQIQRHFPDLVQEHGTAFGDLHLSPLMSQRARKGAFHMAE